MPDWYTASGVPASGGSLSSAIIRGEFTSIETALAKLPALTGNGNKLVQVNSGGTALEAVSSTTGKTFTSACVIAGTDNSNAMLRITQLGTSYALLVEDSANPDASPFAVLGGGETLIGDTAMNSVEATIKAWIRGQSSSTGLGIRSDPATGNPSLLVFEKSVSNGAVSNGNTLARIMAYGHDGTAMVEGARVDFEVSGTPGTNDMPTDMIVKLSPDGSATVAEVIRFKSDKSVVAAGALTSSSATAGIGYSTGAGGTQTQGTSRTTAVTLNKICGHITLVSAAGSASWSKFTVNNSTVAATDEIHVWQVSGTDEYLTHVTAVGSGSFEISFATTGGTTTEQPVFGFAVRKMVTS